MPNKSISRGTIGSTIDNSIMPTPFSALLRPHMDRDPLFDEHLDDGLELHTRQTCFGCISVRNASDESVEGSDELKQDCQNGDGSSVKMQANNSPTTPGSASSLYSNDPGGAFLYCRYCR